MGAYKTGTKGGSFFQLFDWRRPRKKLLAAGSSSPDGAKQAIEEDDCRFPAPPVIQTEDEEDDFNGVSSVTAGSTDYSCDCASSVTNEDITESRAPGVVARLMGLDFLPIALSSEPDFKPSAELKSLEDVQCGKKSEPANPITIIRSGGIYSRKPGDLKCQRMPSSPLEKFQMDILPTRPGKSVSTNQSKLISPVKSHVVMSQSNAAHVLEAFVKVLNPEGHLLNSTTGVRSVRSSSLPQHSCQPPERSAASVTASRLPKLSIKANELNDSRSRKVPHFSIKGNHSDHKVGYRRPPRKTEVNLVTAKGNGKSVAATSQAKVNVLTMEGPKTHKGSLSQSGKPSIWSNKQLKVSIVQKDEAGRKKTGTSMPGALKQNKQKQNCLSDKDKLPLKSLVSKKSIPGGSTPVRNAMSSKVLQDSSLLRQIDSSRIKDSLNENSEVKNSIVARRMRHIKPNVIFDEKFKQGGDSGKKGIDVVSFTFTSIIKQTPLAICEPSMKMIEEEKNGDGPTTDDYCKGNTKEKHAKKMIPSSSFSLNAVGSDTVSILLERKLRELTLVFGSSCSKNANATSDICSSEDPLSPSPLGTFFEIEGESLEDVSCRQDGLPCLSDFSTASNNVFALKSTSIFQKHELATRCDSEDACKMPDYQQEDLECLLNDSCSTSGSYTHSIGNRTYAFRNHCGSPSSTNAEGSEKQLSESSALSFAKNTIEDVELTNKLDHTKRYKEQDEYLKKILLLAESSFRCSVTGYASETLDPCLFELLETMMTTSKSVSRGDKSHRAERKLLFDCVCESFDLKSRQHFHVGYRSWVKGATKVLQGHFADEIYKEILGWRRKGDLIVDEIVDDDMSRCIGRTVYFVNDAFEAGIEIEDDMLTSLICEMVEELLL